MFIVLLTNIVNASSHTKCVSLTNQKFKIQPTLIILYIVMNTDKNYTTIDLRLNQINLLEITILLMTYLMEYGFQTKQKI